MIMSFNFGIRF